MKVIDVLRAARKKIEDERHWTQGELAEDERGKAVHATCDAAQRFCMLGAVASVTRCSAPNKESDYGAAREALRLVTSSSVAEFNDSHTHAEVLAAFGRAIAAEEGKG